MTVNALPYSTINKKALLYTVALHALLLLLFWWLRYSITPIGAAEMGTGLEISLGNSEDGSGAEKPLRSGTNTEYSTTVEWNEPKSAPTPAITAPTDNTDPDAPTVEPAKENKPTNPATKPDNSKPTPHPPAKALFSGAKGGSNQETNTATSAGDGNGTGVKGNPNGSPTGTGDGNRMGNGGIGHNLIGRQISPDKFEAEFSESGKVVIRVTVDRDGNIVNKTPISSTNPKLTAIAMEKLGSSRFSKSSTGEPQQVGTVTFMFRTR